MTQEQLQAVRDWTKRRMVRLKADFAPIHSTWAPKFTEQEKQAFDEYVRAENLPF